jgi:nucleotide-binding universal stress UspA family protein
MRFLIREGNPYTAITQVASELRADAVMVGAPMQPGHRIVGLAPGPRGPLARHRRAVGRS